MDSESDSQDELGFELDGFGGADPYVKVCRTAAGRYIKFLPSP